MKAKLIALCLVTATAASAETRVEKARIDHCADQVKQELVEQLFRDLYAGDPMLFYESANVVWNTELPREHVCPFLQDDPASVGYIIGYLTPKLFKAGWDFANKRN